MSVVMSVSVRMILGGDLGCALSQLLLTQASRSLRSSKPEHYFLFVLCLQL